MYEYAHPVSIVSTLAVDVESKSELIIQLKSRRTGRV